MKLVIEDTSEEIKKVLQAISGSEEHEKLRSILSLQLIPKPKAIKMKLTG